MTVVEIYIYLRGEEEDSTTQTFSQIHNEENTIPEDTIIIGSVTFNLPIFCGLN